MKLYFEPPGLIWSPERYHYAAEQMMLTLFPGQRPEYPEDMPHTLEEPAAVFTLEREGEQARITAQVVWEGGRRPMPPAALLATSGTACLPISRSFPSTTLTVSARPAW